MSKTTASARRCSPCNMSWPYISAYEKCPFCGEVTWIATKEQPLQVAEAKKLVDQHEFEKKAAEERAAARAKVFAEFDAFCQERDQKVLEAMVDEIRALPETKGRRAS